MKTLLVMVLLSISLPDSNDADFLRQALDCIKDPNLRSWGIWDGQKVKTHQN